MRLFIAIDLDESSRRAAAALGAEVARLLLAAGAIDRRGVTWVSEHNLHLTLRFLGEVDEDRARRLVSGLGEPFRTPAFRLTLSGLGVFPPEGQLRVIWIGVGETGGSLSALYREIEARLRLLDFDPESRPFQPHLTLGRFRKPGARRAREVVGTGIRPQEIGPSPVEHVTLYRSDLSPRGPTYTPLVQASLSR